MQSLRGDERRSLEMMHEECGVTQNYVVEGGLLSGVVAVAGLDDESLLVEAEIDLVVPLEAASWLGV